jgi:hypothetical protein
VLNLVGVKVLIDLSKAALQSVRTALGIRSKANPLSRLLSGASAQAARSRDLERLSLGLLPDLEDDVIMASAWQK